MQKPFRLSPFTFCLIAFGFLLLAFCSACSFNPDKQTVGQVYLQGEWQQDSLPAQKQLLSYSSYHFKFTCDSFFVAIKSYSKINTGADSCMSSGHWTEYCRGTYEQRHDTLHMKGLFCNADMSLKDDKGCFRSGDYEEYFKITKKTDSLIQFAGISSVIPINARLIKRTSCIPKPL
ncbi:fumarate hydratase [Mucilaginibacter sp. BJC16-A38]|uniref:fumarate hydratase n=1 Tax=Mucilaginibacter phenanthrenivorans TaxID=1234842 RepID=UPI00215766B6|nr:fumarate hydratase [Mucilaginibacter phenanthrenivorans]MCR8557409.1 fumarate hydratase [Mucilaginibacter phenanthrenivorans]